MRYIMILFCLILLVGCAPDAQLQDSQVDDPEEYCGDGTCDDYEDCFDCAEDCVCVNETIS